MIPNFKTILLVEDDAIIALNKKRELEKYQYTVFHRLDGNKAVEFVTKDKQVIDLVLMDIDLGKGIDGTQAAREILNIKEMPIVFLSSHTEPEIVEKTESITSYGYIVKDSSITVLDASIKMAFKLFDAHRNIENHRNKAEKTVKELQVSINNLSFLNTISHDQANTHNMEELVQLIFKQLLNLTNAVYVTFSEYISNEKLLKNIKISASQAIINLGIKAAGKKILELEVPVNNAYFKAMITERIKIFPSIHEDTDGAVSIKVSSALHKSLKIGNIWRLAYCIDNILYGVSSIALRKDHPPPKVKIMDSFLNISSISIKRLVLEKKLIDRAEKLKNINDIQLKLSANKTQIKTLQNMLDNYEEAIWAVDKNFRYSFMNSYFIKDYKEAFGRKLELGDTAFSMLRPEILKDWGKKYKAAMEGEKTSFEFKENALRGKKYFQVNLNPIHLNNKITGVSAISVDVTRQKLAELKVKNEMKKSQQYLDIAGVMFVAINRNSKITMVNRKLCTTTGYKEEELIGKNWFNIMLPEHLKEEIIPVSQKLLNGDIEPVEYFENPIMTKDGKEIMIAWHNTILKDDNDSIVGHLSSGSDITEKYNFEENIKKLLKEKELILQEVHHRIKNNMTTLISLISLQTNTVKGKEAENALLEIENRIRTMMVLYETLYQSANFQSTSTKDYFSALISDIIQNFPESNIITVNKNISDFEIDTKIIFNIGIIINKLITNSMKYAFKNRSSGKINITFNSKNNNIRLVVEDNGIGIPDDIGLNKNTGFGLKLIMMMVEQMKGDIQIEREKGTKFTIRCLVEQLV